MAPSASDPLLLAVGGSAGSLPVLVDLVRGFPGGMGAAVLVCQHTTQRGASSLPDGSALSTPAPAYQHPKKNWRLKRGATPQWYKQRSGIRTKAQSGAARVARFRPPGLKRP